METVSETSPMDRLKDAAQDPALFEIHWHDITVGVKQSAATWAIGLAGMAMAGLAGFDWSHPSTWLGSIAAGGAALWNLAKTKASDGKTGNLVDVLAGLVEQLRAAKAR